jgi:hypothetical protein
MRPKPTTEAPIFLTSLRFFFNRVRKLFEGSDSDWCGASGGYVTDPSRLLAGLIPGTLQEKFC